MALFTYAPARYSMAAAVPPYVSPALNFAGLNYLTQYGNALSQPQVPNVDWGVPTIPQAPSGPTSAPVAAPTISPEDYTKAIKQDPLFQLAQKQVKAQHQAAIEGLRGAQQRLLIQFGEVPELPSGLGFDLTHSLDDATKSLIAQNTQAKLSTVARLQQSYDQGYRTAINNLASRGLLRSGETGFQLGRLQTGFQQAQYGARQQLLDTLNQAWGGYAQGESARQDALLNAMNMALSRILAYPLPAAPRYNGPSGPSGPEGPQPEPPRAPSRQEPVPRPVQIAEHGGNEAAIGEWILEQERQRLAAEQRMREQAQIAAVKAAHPGIFQGGL